MKLKNPKSIQDALVAGMKKVEEVDLSEVQEYLDDCVAGIAKNHAMGNVECGRVDDLDYWETQTDAFELGLKVASEMGPCDSVYTAYLDPDEHGVDVCQMFYFVGVRPHLVVKELREATKKYLVALRQEKGLLPFGD